MQKLDITTRNYLKQHETCVKVSQSQPHTESYTASIRWNANLTIENTLR